MRQLVHRLDSWCGPRAAAAIATVRGDNSSVTKRVIERLYSCSSLLNDAGQYAYCGRAGGLLITGNEDGCRAGERSLLRRSLTFVERAL